MKVVKSQKKETHFAIFLFIYKNFQRKNYFAVEATCFLPFFSLFHFQLQQTYQQQQQKKEKCLIDDYIFY